MILLGAALAAVSLSLDVPYLPQTDQLCGGAAAAMVFRYLGDTHADVRSFEPLVDRHAGGITTGALVREIERRGYSAETFAGTIALLRERAQHGEPIIVLLKDGRSAYHYVVVVGADEGAVVVHDPSWGPSRPIANGAFERAWAPARHWALAITGNARLKPSAPSTQSERDPEREALAERDSCSTLLDAAIARIGESGLQSADAILESVRRECPQSAGPLRELAGVRFAQKRWAEAAAFARGAIAHDPNDAYAIDVLGSSLFMQDDAAGALEAWNRIGKPRVDRLSIEGPHRARYQAIASTLGLEPGDVLTADAFARASHRLDEWPDRTSARLSLRPGPDGFAVVDAAIAERSVAPTQPGVWAGAGIEAAVDRQVDVALPGPGGQGALWTASWRWWANRPLVDVAFEAPRVAGVANVWRVDASWDEQAYASSASEIARESRVHGGLTISDWLSGRWRYSTSAGLDSWNGARRAASIGGTIERRLFEDSVSVSSAFHKWIALTDEPGFETAAAAIRWRPTRDTAAWSFTAAGSASRASDQAPLDLWYGAGEGRVGADLLRAHPMLDAGIVRTDAAFGRTLVASTVETTRWFDSPKAARVGVAMFVDAARASRTLSGGADPAQVDIGTGLRVRIPGIGRTLRVDVAHGLRDGANAVSVGWIVR